MALCTSVRLVVLASLQVSVAAVALKKQTSERRKNLCIDGRLAPELLLLGAAKASSSSFAWMIDKNDGIVLPECTTWEKQDKIRRKWCPKDGIKELREFQDNTRYHEGKRAWLEHYPSCDKIAGRMVSTDMSPDYLRKPEVPGRLKAFYGNMISQVSFVVLLREPVDCIQSLFYQAGVDSRETFKTYVTSINKVHGETNDGMFMNAMYSKTLAMYFKEFNPAQFTIAGMRWNEGYDLVRHMWSHLELPMPSKLPEPELRNPGDQPEVEDEMDEDTLLTFKYIVYNITGPREVAKVLAENWGPTLFGYKGNARDEDSLARWVEQGW